MSRTPSMIIVIEDDKDDQFLIQNFAVKTELDADFIMMNSGEQLDFYMFREPVIEATSILRIPSLIMLDLNLQGKNGFEILEQLKLHHFFRKVPVIILSTSKSLDDIDKAYSLGCSGYFCKPNYDHEWIDLMSAIKLYWFNCASRPLLRYS